MLIDIHAHAYRVKPPYIGFCTMEELLRAQEIHGIDKSVVLPIVSPEIYIPQDTADIIEMARLYPDRTFRSATLTPARGRTIRMRRWRRFWSIIRNRAVRVLAMKMKNAKGGYHDLSAS